MAQDSQKLTGTVPASGTVRLSIRPTNRREWIVSQVTTKAPGVGIAAESNIYKSNGVRVTELVPTGSTASGLPYVPVSPSESLIVEWTGATPGATVEASFLYDDGAG